MRHTLASARGSAGQPKRPTPRRSVRWTLAAALTLLAGASATGSPPALAQAVAAAPAAVAPAAVTADVERPAIVPLSPEQEARRAAAAQQLYGSPQIRPLEQRKTSAIAMGDSQMSGEGAYDSSLYDPNTDREGNYCHRARTAVGLNISIDVDAKYNIACSGAQTFQILSTKQGGVYYFEENQGDQLEVLARNTNIKYIYIFIGANDPEGLNFGPRLTSCVESRVFLGDVCWPANTNDANRAVGVVATNVAAALKAVRQTMTEAGYLDTDYKFVNSGYPSPINPNWDTSDPYAGGCMVWEADAYFARNKVVPMFANAQRAASQAAGVQFLDMRTIFDGHSPCTGQAWVTGLFNSTGDIFDANAWRQSFHPNPNGHKAFDACFSAAYASDNLVMGCSIKAGDFMPTFTAEPMQQVEIRHAATGTCVGALEARSQSGYDALTQPCLGSILTNVVVDQRDGTIHRPQSYDKCWTVHDLNGSTEIYPGNWIQMGACDGGRLQQFDLRADGTIAIVAKPELCLTVPDGPTDFSQRLEVTGCNAADAGQRFATTTPENHLGHFTFDDGGLCITPTTGWDHMPSDLIELECGSNPMLLNWQNGADRSYIIDDQGVFCFNGAPWEGQRVSQAQCTYQFGDAANNGQFMFDREAGLIRSRLNPNLVLTGGGRGYYLRLLPEGSAPHQKVTFVPTANAPGEGYNDWLPPVLNQPGG